MVRSSCVWMVGLGNGPEYEIQERQDKLVSDVSDMSDDVYYGSARMRLLCHKPKGEIIYTGSKNYGSLLILRSE